LLEFEYQAWGSGHTRLAGVDEAGRGPLAGPVVAAALVFNREFVEAEAGGLLSEVNDSKQLSESKRESLFLFLTNSPFVEIGVGVAGSAEIDSINIARATHAAMILAIRDLSPLPDHVLVDGLPVPGLPCSSTAIIRGDSLSLSIAAASIVAKVTRDRMMRELDRKYPGYGFAKHKGYGTREHTRALLEYGPTPVHRFSFRPVKDAQEIHARLGKEPANAE